MSSFAPQNVENNVLDHLGTVPMRSLSIISQGDNQSEMMQLSKMKEAIRTHYKHESQPFVQKYTDLDGT